MLVLTRPEGTPPGDIRLSRRGVLGAGAFATGYAAFALSADAQPITTDAQGLIVAEESLTDGDIRLPAYVARPAAAGRHPTVIVINEVFGVHAYIQDVCRRFAKLGYVAIAPQFFVRSDPGNTLAKTTDFSVVMKLVSQAKVSQVMGDLRATLAWLKTQPYVDAHRLALTGFCWGGGEVWEASATFRDFKAAAAWYGQVAPPASGASASDPDRMWPVQQAAQMKVPVIGFYGGQDKGIPTASVDAMREALAKAGKTGFELHSYPDAQHGFHADYRSSYDPAAAKDAWSRMLAFFAAHGVGSTV